MVLIFFLLIAPFFSLSDYHMENGQIRKAASWPRPNLMFINLMYERRPNFSATKKVAQGD